MKIKKITMGSLAALATIAIPVATVASCGNEEYKTVTLTWYVYNAKKIWL
ncbi:Vmc-like lipoprotein signal peptide domain-containing protein [Mycoplasma marinum]|nr:hypothetical protein [Mycoplasma marinum]